MVGRCQGYFEQSMIHTIAPTTKNYLIQNVNSKMLRKPLLTHPFVNLFIFKILALSVYYGKGEEKCVLGIELRCPVWWQVP